MRLDTVVVKDLVTHELAFVNEMTSWNATGFFVFLFSCVVQDLLAL